MVRNSRRRRQRRNRDILFGSLLLAFVVAAVGAIGFLTLSKSEGLDAASLCPAAGPQGHYVLLVDKTDPLSFTQKEAFAVTLRDIIEKRIPEGFLFSVFVLGDDIEASAKPLVELCNPGSGAGKSEWTANLKRLRRQYEEGFLGPLIQQSNALLTAQPAKSSPILEMLQLVGINGFRARAINGERRLFIMSDMLHNTAQFSMYKGALNYESFSATPYGRKTHSELRGVEVELHYLINTPQLQTRRNLKFWEDYFDDAGARIVAVRPLEG